MGKNNLINANYSHKLNTSASRSSTSLKMLYIKTVQRCVEMGSPSPTGDYIVRRLSIEAICSVGSTVTSWKRHPGFRCLNQPVRWCRGRCCCTSGGKAQFAKLRGQALIMDDGEPIKGDAAQEIEVMRRIMFFINSIDVDDISL